MTLSDEAFAELQAEWQVAVKDIIAGKPDRTDLMLPLNRVSAGSRLIPDDIINSVAEITGISRQALLGRNKSASYCRARHLMLYVANEVFPDTSSSELARKFDRDATTILNSMRRAAYFMENDSDFVTAYRRVRFQLGLEK